MYCVAMNGCILTPPVTPGADLGALFMHNEGYSTMCGHGTIALVTALLATGAMPARGKDTPVNLDTPAGLVRATAHLDSSGHVENVSFLNVPSFLYARDIELDVSNYGRVQASPRAWPCITSEVKSSRDSISASRAYWELSALLEGE